MAFELVGDVNGTIMVQVIRSGTVCYCNLGPFVYEGIAELRATYNFNAAVGWVGQGNCSLFNLDK
jgi:hypothetical protein